MMRAFVFANAASFTYLQICLEPGRLFNNALGRTVEPAGGAFDTFVPIHVGPFRTPISGFQLRINGCDGAEVVGYL